MARRGFAVIFTSASFSDSATTGPYFAQNGSVNANGVAEWRRQITTASSAASRP